MTIQSNPQFTATFDGVFDQMVDMLKETVAIQSVSNGRQHQDDIDTSAQYMLQRLLDLGVKAQIREAGGNPAVVGYIGAGEGGDLDPSKHTVLLYAHHDVQPAQDPDAWDTDPFVATVKETADGLRMFGRGAADDGGGLAAHVGALTLFKDLGEKLPVNVKFFIEGEEEVGSPSFDAFVEKYADDLKADTIIVADSGNWAVGVPAITSTLRGVCTVEVELAVGSHTIHSGMSTGPIIDANSLLMRVITSIWDDKGNIVVPGLLGAKGFAADGGFGVAEPAVDYPEADFRKDSGVLDGVELAGEGSLSGRIWNKPSVTVIGFDAVSVADASNVFAPSARAVLSLRVAPGQDSPAAAEALAAHLRNNVPLNAKFKATVLESGPSFKADLEAPATVAFSEALKDGFGEDVVYSGMGGSIPFTATLNRIYPDATVLLAGVEDPDSRAHSDNESIHLGDLKKVILSEALLLEKLASI